MTNVNFGIQMAIFPCEGWVSRWVGDSVLRRGQDDFAIRVSGYRQNGLENLRVHLVSWLLRWFEVSELSAGCC